MHVTISSSACLLLKILCLEAKTCCCFSPKIKTNVFHLCFLCVDLLLQTFKFKINILSFTHCYVVQILYAFISFMEHIRYSEECK